jgi:hypothetical protein
MHHEAWLNDLKCESWADLKGQAAAEPSGASHATNLKASVLPPLLTHVLVTRHCLSPQTGDVYVTSIY